jgi:haloacetate dehalogenase
LDGFEYSSTAVGPTTYRLGIAGSGPAVLLLHGFPQTHYCWHRVAPALAQERTVVVCDLKGYGESRSAPGVPLGEGYSKREMAAELVKLMAGLGFERFSVVGHDRGGRVAYRMALDHPDFVERLGVLNIVPTVDQFERMAADASLDYYPWFLLAQPPPFAERLVGASAEYFLRHVLTTWAATPDAISADATERYLRAFTPEVISGMCADYRASFHIDRPMDAEDRRAGNAIRCPARALGSGGGRDVRRSAPRLATMGGPRRRRPAPIGPLHPRGGPGRTRRVAEALPGRLAADAGPINECGFPHFRAGPTRA